MVGVLALAGVANATSVIRMDLKDLCERAELVVHGRCVSVTPRQSPEGDIVSDVRLAVLDGLKGLGEERELEFAVYGGILGNRGSAISGAPTFEIDEELLVFLGPANKSGLRTVIGLAQGKYTIRVEGRQRLAYRNLEGLRLVDPTTGEASDAEPEQGVPFDDLLARVREHLRGE